MPTLKPYPAYADTDLPWLPKIPKHWEVKRLKQVADVAFSSVDKHSKEDEQSVLLCNYVDVYKNEHITRDLEFMQATASSDEVQRFTLKEGDVMITKDSESWNDIAVPAYVLEDLDNVLCGYHLALLRPKSREMDGKFLFRALQARPMSYQFEVEATGITRYGIDQYAISSTFFPVPPLPEQRRIAAYLDRQTAKIDALIAKKQRLLDLLAEQRAALISQAVTKGLNPAVKMKDSGAAWLGQVPIHWEVIPLKRIVTLKSGEGITTEDIYEEGEYPVYGGNGLRGYTSSFSHEGDFVLIGRQGALCGNVNYASGKFWASEHAVVAFPTKEFVTGWIGEVLRAMNLNQYSISAAQPGIAVDRIRQLSIPLPPIEEQQNIADFISEQYSYIDNLAIKIETAIARLQEYRAALISSVVTGKVKV